jgi:hypothetical protein
MIAVLRIVVPTGVLGFTVAWIASVAGELGPRSPMVHVPVELAYVPREGMAFTRVNVPGKVSVATTPVDVAGPKAFAVII